MENSNRTSTENGYLSRDVYPTSRHFSVSWLDLRVFYVRVSKCELDASTPQQLTLNHIPLDPSTLLEVNGVRANHSDDDDDGVGVSTVLRRDRIDKRSEEATFVSTDSIRLSGSVKFEVMNYDMLILSGILRHNSNGYVENAGKTDHESQKWRLVCKAHATSGSGFLRGKQYMGEMFSPKIEVYVAGSYLGNPTILSNTLQFSSQNKKVRKGTMNSIPGNGTVEDYDGSSSLSIQEVGYQEYKSDDDGYNYHDEHVQQRPEDWEGEDGQLSWFNAGVRVGVGIGLSVCLGVGIGVGLVVKTYQGATRTFRRRLL